MRLDRFITLHVVQPLRGLMRGTSGSGETSLPVLMYHSISDDPEPRVGPYYRVCTSPRGFREQMEWMRDNGYQGVTLSEGLARLAADSKAKIEDRRWKMEDGRAQAGNPISDLRSPISSDRPVAITFDDGFRDFHTAAWPVLRELGFTATMFLATGFIGEGGSKMEEGKSKIGERKGVAEIGKAESGNLGGDLASVLCPPTSGLRPAADLRSSISDLQPSGRRSFQGKECLTWNEVRVLQKAGMEFGSHTVNHPKLVELCWAEIERELRDSKAELERQLGEPATTFAYPYAFPEHRRDFVERFKDVLKSSGYATNVTTQIGRHRLGDDVMQIKRLPANSLDDAALLEAKLAGGYDWLARPQGLIKRLKSKAGIGKAESTKGAGKEAGVQSQRD